MTNPSRFHLIDRTRTEESHAPAQALEYLRESLPPERASDFRKAAPRYQLDEAFETALNMAITVGAPLLVTGEPGTGKTQAAYYLGWYFGVKVFSYQVRSTSTAEDLKYDFDAVAYLRSAQHPEEDGRRLREEFLQKNALWLAYDHPDPCVLLIDEIDKAPRDFPNDLLLELDKHEFQHPFREEPVKPVCKRPPIVVITSNEERRLPDPFLRRCIFHHIELTEDLVRRAMRAREDDFPELDERTKNVALDRFWELRTREDLDKKPSTAELLTWLTILSAKGIDAAKLSDALLAELPCRTALLKDSRDLKLIEGRL